MAVERHSGDQAGGGGQAARTGDNAQRHDHHQPKQGERPDQRRRIGNHPAEHREERCVAGGLEVLEVRVTERLGQCERVRTLVLQAGRVEVVDGVVRMVVVGAAADRPELQPGEPMLAQHREVGVERPEPVDLRDRRLTDRVGRRSRELPDQPGVAGGRVVQRRRSGVAGTLEVEQDAAVAGVRVLPGERLRADEPWLLTIAEQQDDVVARPLARGEHTRDLQDGRDGCLVVAGAR